MTVRESVHQFLKDNAGAGYTNDQIAAALVIPEPSVRRATLELEKANRINFERVSTRGRILWMAQPAVQVQHTATV
jgi:hypothetical protein